MTSGPVVCARCGRQADAVPATWTSAPGADGVTRLCDACTRQHLRSIEARLDEGWWEPRDG